jgi:hypothetical protein
MKKTKDYSDSDFRWLSEATGLVVTLIFVAFIFSLWWDILEVLKERRKQK